MQVTISHPHGNPNSFHAARAFLEKGWLRSFHTGYAKFEENNLSLANTRRYLRWKAAAAIGRRLRTGGLTPRVNWYDVLFCGHDWQVSRRLEKKLDAVYAYEDGARLTFEAAKQRSLTKIYELPLGYFLGVANELERAGKTLPELISQIKHEPAWKQVRKDSELELADLIVVPCEWARESLNFSKAQEKVIVKVPYGTPADEVLARTKQPDDLFTVLFAGQIGVRKGAPLLIKAWKHLGLKDARLLMAGSLNLDEKYLGQHNSIQYLGRLPRVRLLEVMRETDLFVFPSLAEGFGLVIGEAMAAGVPVLTTTNTGGPELITDEREGWCVPAYDVDSLAERIEWAYQHRDALYEMGRLARYRAEQWTWADYRRKLIEELSKHIGTQGN